MDKIRYTYKSGETVFVLDIVKEYGKLVLSITADLRHIEGGDLFSREYDIFDKVCSVDMNGEYVVLHHLDSLCFTQLKFEYGSCIVIDEFDSQGEHINSIGCHDFNDDIVLEDE